MEYLTYEEYYAERVDLAIQISYALKDTKTEMDSHLTTLNKQIAELQEQVRMLTKILRNVAGNTNSLSDGFAELIRSLGED